MWALAPEESLSSAPKAFMKPVRCHSLAEFIALPEPSRSAFPRRRVCRSNGRFLRCGGKNVRTGAAFRRPTSTRYSRSQTYRKTEAHAEPYRAAGRLPREYPWDFCRLQFSHLPSTRHKDRYHENIHEEISSRTLAHQEGTTQPRSPRASTRASRRDPLRLSGNSPRHRTFHRLHHHRTA